MGHFTQRELALQCVRNRCSGNAARVELGLKSSLSSTWTLPEQFSSELLARATPHRLAADQTLFAAGDPGDGCYCLDKGVLKVSLFSPNAVERILALLAAGTVVGDLSMIDGMPRSASVTALTDCELRFFSRATFEEVTLRHPEIYAYLVKVLAVRLRQANDTIAASSFMTMHARLARALLEVADCLGEETSEGKTLIPVVNQRDLAAMAEVARENANRILGEWERRSLVTRVAHSYEIDRIRLEREAK